MRVCNCSAIFVLVGGCQCVVLDQLLPLLDRVRESEAAAARLQDHADAATRELQAVRDGHSDRAAADREHSKQVIDRLSQELQAERQAARALR